MSPLAGEYSFVSSPLFEATRVLVGPGDRVKRRFQRKSSALGLLSSAEDALKRRMT